MHLIARGYKSRKKQRHANVVLRLHVLIQRELKAKKEEFDRWKNVPEWKKRLILDKEKKKQQEMVQQLLNFHLYSIVNFRNIYAVKINKKLD